MWALGTLPQRLVLSPGQDLKGRTAQWRGAFEFSLSAPILDFRIDQLSDSTFHKVAASILKLWIYADEGNLMRIRSGLPRFSMPQCYKPNEMILSAWESHTLAKATERQIEESLDYIEETVQWLGCRFAGKGDLVGATKAAILLDHIDQQGMFIELWHCLWKLNERLRDDDRQKWEPFSGIHKLGGMIEDTVSRALSSIEVSDEENCLPKKREGTVTTCVHIGLGKRKRQGGGSPD